MRPDVWTVLRASAFFSEIGAWVLAVIMVLRGELLWAGGVRGVCPRRRHGRPTVEPQVSRCDALFHAVGAPCPARPAFTQAP